MRHHPLPLTNEEIERKIVRMKIKPVNLTQFQNLLKDILLRVQETMTQIVNMSLTTGTFPLDWKTAIIRPPIKRQD